MVKDTFNLSKFEEPSYIQQDTCVVCENPLNEPLIELPKYPITEIQIPVETEDIGYLDQEFHLCDFCGHGQLKNIIDPNILYGREYSHRTSSSSASKEGNSYFRQYILNRTENIKFETIIEVGANDLYLLSSLEHKAETLVGIDPALQNITPPQKDNIYLIEDYFQNVDLSTFVSNGPILVISSHTLEHLQNPKQCLSKLLAETNTEARYIFQFPGFEFLVDELRFGQIFHHHLHYFSLHSFTKLISDLDGDLLDHDENNQFWGSLLVDFELSANRNGGSLKNHGEPHPIKANYCQKRWKTFKNMMDFYKEIITNHCQEPLFGYGAILTLPVLNYHLDNSLDRCRAILDDDTSKDGLNYLNMSPPIRSNIRGNDIVNSDIVITAINHARSILRNLINDNPRRIVVPAKNI